MKLRNIFKIYYLYLYINLKKYLKLTFYVNSGILELCVRSLVSDALIDTLFVRVETKMMENKGIAGRKFAWEIPVVKLSAHNADGYNLQCRIHGKVEGAPNIQTDSACKA